VKLIVGLGNPGRKYQATRHNVGFLVIDQLAQQNHVIIDHERCSAVVGEWSRGDLSIILAKPQTFMNRSGIAVKELLEGHNATADDLLVVFDDLDLPFGRIRIRPQGSAAGHRGILSIQEQLGSASFCRVRIGIGRPPEAGEPADYVLEPFTATEQDALPEVIERAAASIECLLAEGIERAMNQFNRAT
jgi:peptidyl-tRNA hydrolase, PTH1 family